MVPSQILSQHAEEAAFHWILRDAAVWAPHYDLRDLAKLDGRLDAHVDGLRVAGEGGWDAVKEELAWEEPGEVFVAMLLALEAGDEGRVTEALAIGAADPELARGAISALGWLPVERARPWITRFLSADDSGTRAIGIGGAAVQRQDPGKALVDAIEGDDAFPRKRALQAAGELGRLDLLPHCARRYEAESEDERFRAAWSGALRGDAGAVSVLAAIAQGGAMHAEQAADLAARCMPASQALAWSSKLLADESLGRVAVRAAGATGDPAMVPWLFERMAAEPLSRLAGEAFTTLTGLDLAFLDMERDAPEDFQSGPSEDPEDEDVALDPDEDLPWPDLEKVKNWWARNAGAYAVGTRYVLGKPHSPAAFVSALANGRQRQRAVAALQLALARPGQALFETRAPGFRQIGAIRES